MLHKPLRQLLQAYFHCMNSHDLNEIQLLQEMKTIRQLHQQWAIEPGGLLNYPKLTRIEQMVYLILLNLPYNITSGIYINSIYRSNVGKNFSVISIFIHTNVDNRDAKFISRFPFKFNNTGTKTNNSVTLVKTGQY